MKRKLYIIPLMCGLLSLGSCEGFLKEEPLEIQTQENALTSLEDVEKALTGAYYTLNESDGYYLHFSMVLPEMMADNVYNAPNTGGGSEVTFANFNFLPTDPDLELAWAYGYSLINRANATLEKLEEFKEEDPARARQLQGEALALRAMGHFDLLKNFGTSLDRTNGEANSGIPIVLTTALEYPSRNSVKQVYDQLFADLEQAITLLADTPTGDVYRFNRLSVQALAARVALYGGVWDKAATYSDAVIAEAGLADQAAFENIWQNDGEDGVLFKVFANPEQSLIFGFYSQSSLASIEKRPSPAVYSLYDQANDIRFATYLEEDPELGQMIVKYKGKNNDESTDIELIRTGEMFLISAEAHFRQEDEDLALDRLNALRHERLTNATDLTQINESVILEERRRELAFEGQRFYDLKRLGKDLDRSEMADQPKVTVDYLAAGDKRWIFPIPRRELVVNTNLEQSKQWK